MIRCGRMSSHLHLPDPGQDLQTAHSITAIHDVSDLDGTPEPTPFLKWAGGKRRLLRDYEPHFPACANSYHEPFLGSGAVFLRARARLRPQRVLLSDCNTGVVNAYRAVRDSTERLIDLLEQHHRLHDRKHYYAVRALCSSDLDRVEQAARFIYLNRTCYNGLYRVNSRGQFNVPMGRYARPLIVNADNLRNLRIWLRGVHLRTTGFERIVEQVRSGDFVYLDPAYHPLSETANFTSYTEHPFTARDQERLAKVVGALDAAGCLVMLSNSDVPLIRHLYRNYRLLPIEARRSINCNPHRRGPLTELLVLNY